MLFMGLGTSLQDGLPSGSWGSHIRGTFPLESLVQKMGIFWCVFWHLCEGAIESRMMCLKSRVKLTRRLQAPAVSLGPQF